MPRWKAALGYAWALAALPIVLATFMGSGPSSRALAHASGLRISPRFTGGEVSRTVEHGAYRAVIHRPVFDGVCAERKGGFVQVDWEPTPALPDIIDESIAAEGCGKFRVRLDTLTGKAELLEPSSEVKGLLMVSRLRAGWAVRVDLLRP
jgi:hypothetical protein